MATAGLSSSRCAVGFQRSELALAMHVQEHGHFSIAPIPFAWFQVGIPAKPAQSSHAAGSTASAPRSRATRRTETRLRASAD